MKFKNNSQRAAVMAKFRSMGLTRMGAQYCVRKGIMPEDIKNKNFRVLQRQGVFLKYQGDADKDGVKNAQDCRPLNPKKQGFLHDWEMKRLKAKEEKIEEQRHKAEKRLADLKDELKLRKKVSQKSMDVKQSEIAAKDALVKELKEEQERKDNIIAAEKQIKNEMDNYTWQGKTKKFLAHTGEVSKEEAKKFGGEIKRRWNSDQAKKNRDLAAKYAKKGFKKLWRQIK